MGDPLKKKAYYMRLAAAILNTLIVAVDFGKAQEKLEGLQREDGKEGEVVKTEEKLGELTVGMVKNVCDVITYANSAEVIKMLTGSSYNDGTIGLIGSVSALAGGYAVWLKM